MSDQKPEWAVPGLSASVECVVTSIINAIGDETASVRTFR